MKPHNCRSVFHQWAEVQVSSGSVKICENVFKYAQSSRRTGVNASVFFGLVHSAEASSALQKYLLKLFLGWRCTGGGVRFFYIYFICNDKLQCRFLFSFYDLHQHKFVIGLHFKYLACQIKQTKTKYIIMRSHICAILEL